MYKLHYSLLLAVVMYAGSTCGMTSGEKIAALEKKREEALQEYNKTCPHSLAMYFVAKYDNEAMAKFNKKYPQCSRTIRKLYSRSIDLLEEQKRQASTAGEELRSIVEKIEQVKAYRDKCLE